MIFVIIVKTLLLKLELTIWWSSGRLKGVCNWKFTGSRPVSTINPRGALKTSVQSSAVDLAERSGNP